LSTSIESTLEMVQSRISDIARTQSAGSGVRSPVAMVPFSVAHAFSLCTSLSRTFSRACSRAHASPVAMVPFSLSCCLSRSISRSISFLHFLAFALSLLLSRALFLSHSLFLFFALYLCVSPTLSFPSSSLSHTHTHIHTKLFC